MDRPRSWWARLVFEGIRILQQRSETYMRVKIVLIFLSLVGVIFLSGCASEPQAGKLSNKAGYHAGISDADHQLFEDTKAKAESGDAQAQGKLADCYFLGKGVNEDLAEAAKWYRKAANQGDSR